MNSLAESLAELTFVTTLHVLVAVLGLGLVGAAALVARPSAGSGPAADELRVILRQLALGINLSLGVMLLTGLLAEALAGWPFHGTYWFRLGFLLLVVAGGLNGWMGATLRKRWGTPVEALATARSAAIGMTVAVGLSVILMELKPF